MTGEVVWSGTSAGLDAALLALAEPVPGLRWRPVRWGRLTGQRPGVPATAVGFPRVLRAEDGARVPDQPSGTVNPGVAFGERYDLSVDPPHPLAKADDPSPWSGLSGACLFSDLYDRQFLIGVVVIDTPRFRAGRLTSVPVWRLLADPAFAAVLAEHGLSARWESVELAGLFDRPAGRRDSPASLLRADNAVVRFRGRAQSLEELRGWCDDDWPLAFGLVTGPGGQGKTRLAWQLCARLRAAGWVAGFAAPGPRAGEAAGRLVDSRLPTLVVIDYAETRTEQVRELVVTAGEPASPVRLLLLARSAGEWWQQLRSELRYHLGAPWQALLPPLEDSSAGRAAAYHDAVEDLAGALPRLPGRAGTDWAARAGRLPHPDLSDPAFGAVLTIQLHALTGLLSADNPPRRLHPDELEDILLEHGELY